MNEKERIEELEIELARALILGLKAKGDRLEELAKKFGLFRRTGPKEETDKEFRKRIKFHLDKNDEGP